MAKIVKVINGLKPDEAIFRKIESNASITHQEGKPFSNHTKASLFNTQFLKTTITIKLIKRTMNKRSFGSSFPINLL
ncbi:hypothetical protein [Prochlorococcus marinus]|uniref:hypothetical protein n=1 Tax=Prochlorococcus marinus TaxID=1219 RepID=UPI00130EDFBC|nr:hypothetical protein [Prochlorococcus marinus]